MVRKAINLLSPIAALAVMWVSLQSLVVSGTETTKPLAPQTTVVTPATEGPGVLPELSSVSQILTDTSTAALTESVPDAVARILAANGAVLLVPDPPGDGGRL
ncbi:MAG: hypothetical protein ACR2OI_12165 [Acidimicrobiia bacterium]